MMSMGLLVPDDVAWARVAHGAVRADANLHGGLVSDAIVIDLYREQNLVRHASDHLPPVRWSVSHVEDIALLNGSRP